MELLSNISDDKLALFGSLVALTISGGLMSMSYYLRREGADKGCAGRQLSVVSCQSQSTPSQRTTD